MLFLTVSTEQIDSLKGSVCESLLQKYKLAFFQYKDANEKFAT